MRDMFQDGYCPDRVKTVVGKRQLRSGPTTERLVEVRSNGIGDVEPIVVFNQILKGAAAAADFQTAFPLEPKGLYEA
jgi:hypothetical protein